MHVKYVDDQTSSRRCSVEVKGDTSGLCSGSQVVKVSDCGGRVMSSSPVPLRACRVGAQCTLNLSIAQTFSRWCDVVPSGYGHELVAGVSRVGVLEPRKNHRVEVVWRGGINSGVSSSLDRGSKLRDQ
ncbi:hypothetical protein TNCV_1134231 [Trichonephila clavipes]|nr:hypothetical protein TNCV_1134231 [Trichonephila clavipes]